VSVWSVEGLASHLDGFRLGPIDLSLSPGHVVAVLGRSGAGKTTLLRAVAGFLPVDAGRVLRDGSDLTGRPPEARALGYVPQGLGLFPHRTVERNVSYPLEMRGRLDARVRSRELLERFGLTPLARRYPARLSGGELERVALARALASEPELILWDEPWQALDVGARYALGQVFDELRDAARVPSIVVTHDPDLAFSVADSFLVLRAGQVDFHGSPAELLDHPTDAFAARFVGYENVYERSQLDRGAPGSLARWLAERSGPGGIAVPRPIVPALTRPSGAWEGVVRRVHPSPEGIALTLAVPDLALALRLAAPAASPPPALGDRVRFDVEEKSLRPLGVDERAGAPAPA
jgi:ABC-type Fe3+/spermidine/putrescine transport system ATPase subunit